MYFKIDLSKIIRIVKYYINFINLKFKDYVEMLIETSLDNWRTIQYDNF